MLTSHALSTCILHFESRKTYTSSADERVSIGGYFVVLSASCLENFDADIHLTSSQRCHSINLTLNALKTFDTAIKRWYATWLQDAPLSYKSDGFFVDRIPISVTSVYGQNQPLAMWDEDEDEDTHNWSRSRDFTKLKCVSFSIASHFEYVHLLKHFKTFFKTLTFVFHRVEEVSCWRDRDLLEIRNDHGDLFYDSIDTDTREEISFDQLHDLPMFDEAGNQIHIYTEDGFRIQRRLAGYRPDGLPHGVLLDLRDVGLLFKSEESETPFSVFPQAGLVTVGHIQAEGVTAPFLPLLQQLNSKVRVQDDDPMNDDDSDSCAPIIGIACQAYNAVMHNTRGRRAQHHDAQRGLVTAALAGGFARTDSNIRKAKVLQHQCSQRLPHLEFKQKIANNNDEPLDCSLRFENTFVVHMDQLNHLYHDGGFVYCLLCYLNSSNNVAYITTCFTENLWQISSCHLACTGPTQIF